MQSIIDNGVGALPGLNLQYLIELLSQYFFVSLRVGAFLIASPLFGARFVILPVRIMVSMVVTFLIISLTPELPDIRVMSSFDGVSIAITEIALGLSAGLTLTIIFAAIGLAGEKIAASSGLSMATMVDPSSGGSTPVISQILVLFMLVIFMSFDGHLIVLRTIIESYKYLPIGEGVDGSVLIQAGILATEQMYFSGALIMLPIALILLLINVAIGVITRSAPTLNLFSFGFPITMLGVFFILYLAVGSLGLASSELGDKAIFFMQDMIGALSNG